MTSAVARSTSAWPARRGRAAAGRAGLSGSATAGLRRGPRSTLAALVARRIRRARRRRRRARSSWPLQVSNGHLVVDLTGAERLPPVHRVTLSGPPAQTPVEPKPPPRLAPSSTSTGCHVDLGHRLHHELRDPVAAADLERLGGVEVHEQHLELVAVARVDEPRRVEAGDPVAERQAAAGLHEPGVALRDGERDARRHEGPAARRARA